jgi:REP element-mobilizing transposase RayT
MLQNRKMARPLRICYPNAFYHVTCRGNDRRAIFKDDQDRRAFLERLRQSLQIYTVRLHAYVLMNNHFHLIVETPKANLSEFMRHFNVSYTGYYNRRHRRVGHLYQGRFKAIVVDRDTYLLELSRYVHLNPVRIKSPRQRGGREQLRELQNWSWSSLAGYLESKSSQAWVSYEAVLGEVGGSRDRYVQFVRDGLNQGYRTPWEDLRGQVVLGEKSFVEALKRSKGRVKGNAKDQPSYRMLQRIDVQEIIEQAASYFKLAREELTKKRSGHRRERAVIMELMHRHSGIKQRAIGERVGGLDEALVSRERKTIREKIESDSRVRKWYRDIEARLTTKIKI